MSAMTDNDIKSDCLKVEDGRELLLTLIHDGDGYHGDSMPGKISVGKNARLEIIVLLLSAIPESGDEKNHKDTEGDFKLKCEISLAGEGANCDICGAVICKGNDRSDIELDIRHLVPECKSSQSFRTIASGNSRCSFHGKITVSPGAQKTEAYQESHSILLSENAKVETLPQLEIYADDVKCSHGATVGKLDENQIFYMRSRGISEKTAREIMLKAFVSPIVSMIKENTEQERVISYIDKLLITF